MELLGVQAARDGGFGAGVLKRQHDSTLVLNHDSHDYRMYHDFFITTIMPIKLSSESWF